MQNRTFPLFAASTINAFGAGMFFPFALLYYQDVSHLSVGAIGSTLTVATAIGLVANPLTGVIIDRVGAKRLVVASQIIEAIGFIGYLFVDSRLSLMLAAIVATSGSRIFYASFSTLIAEVSSGHETDIWYARTSVAQTIGNTISGTAAALMIWALGPAGFRIAIGVTISCLLFVAVIVRRIEVPARHVSDRGSAGYGLLLRDGRFIIFVAANCAIVTWTMFWGIGSVLYITQAIGVPLVATSVIGISTSSGTILWQTRLTSRLVGRDRTQILAAGCGLLALACMMIGLASNAEIWLGFAIVFVGAITLSVATMLYMPTARSLAVRMAPPGLTGRYVATYELSWGAAASMAPMALGRSYDIFPALPWFFAAMVATLVAFGFRAAPNFAVK